jgi:hypothetical protein
MEYGRLEVAKRAQALHEKELINRSDLVAVAVGERTVGGENTGEPCVKTFVVRKLLRDELPPDRLLPTTLRLEDKTEVRVDVEEMEPPTSPPPRSESALQAAVQQVAVPYIGMSIQELRQRRRPALGGDSVGHYLFPIGTIATAVRDREYSGVHYVLSCNHVIARLNGALLGDAVLQPAVYDSGFYPQDLIARVSRFVTLRFDPGSSNRVDAAIAYAQLGQVLPQVAWLGEIQGVRRIDGVRVREVVRKVGRTSGLTEGRVVGINASVKINYASLGYGNRVALFRQQLLTRNMCSYGDSGSLLVDADNNAVGLLFAGSSTHTIYNYIENVVDELGIKMGDKLV